MSVFSDNIFTQDPLASVIEEKTVQLKDGDFRAYKDAEINVGEVRL